MRIPRPIVTGMLAVVLVASYLDSQARKTANESGTTAARAQIHADQEKIRAHVKFLASDRLQGRGTGQPGGDMAAEYIATRFAAYGLKPAGENGTYFQAVPMVEVKTLGATSFTLVATSLETTTLKNLEDFVTNNENQTEAAYIDAPIVFVGFGIKAPEYGWDDYKTTDMKGKVALLFVNEPTSDDAKLFNGKVPTYYGEWAYKFQEAARRGAIAALIIHRTDLAGFGWEVVRNSWGKERLYLERDATPRLRAASWIQADVAKKLVGMAGLDLEQLFTQAQSKDFTPVELPVRLQAYVASQLRPFVSKNALAVLPAHGSMSHEAVLYTAHYDSLGRDPDIKNDNVYHGAVDNATGCAVLLEAARLWSQAPPAPRMILFAAVTAEVQGLLGSEYLGKHSPVPPGKISLALNYDALLPIGDPEEVRVIGADRTTFRLTLQQQAKAFGLAIRPETPPEAERFYRLDDFSLARAGIPAFSIAQGLKFKGREEAWGAAQERDYAESRYRQPADAYHPEMDFTGAAKMAMFGYELGVQAAAAPELIAWLPGDEFQAAREASQLPHLKPRTNRARRK
ncbi:MAG TPA: M28 family peptidase [Terriglobales bacterium]|nr:M28 family peptidase [Terriglobales bacterium]